MAQERRLMNLLRKVLQEPHDVLLERCSGGVVVVGEAVIGEEMFVSGVEE